jgi:hypothetical protein
VKKTSKQDEQDSSTDSSTRLTPQLKDDSSPNLSTNGLLNRHRLLLHSINTHTPFGERHPMEASRPRHTGAFEIPRSFHKALDLCFLPIVDIPHHHLIGCVDWLLNATLFHEALDPCFYLLSIFCTTTFIGCVDRLLNATLFHEALDPCFYLLSIFCTTTFIGCVDRLLNATLFHEALDPCFYLLSIFCTTTFIGCVDRLLNATLSHKAIDLHVFRYRYSVQSLYWLRQQAFT